MSKRACRPTSPRCAVLAILLALLPMGLCAATTTTTRGAPDPESAAMVRQWNGECIACHSGQGVLFPPRPGLDLKRLAQATIDPFAFAKSEHAGLACKTCHGPAYIAYPHAPGASTKALACNDCHARLAFRVQAEFDKSVHAHNKGTAFGCDACHDPHADRVARELGDPQQIVEQDNGKCLSCHNSDRKFAQYSSTPLTTKARPDIDKIHAWLPDTKRHWQAVRCIECHTPPSTHRTLALSHRVLDAKEAQRNCVVCHSKDSALNTRLYRHLAQAQTDAQGFLNSAILGNTYVIGATRNVHLDRLTFWLVGGLVAAVLLHGALRIIGHLIRRRRTP